MTALFVVMFVGQWQGTKKHRPALIGVGAALLALLLFRDRFMIPAMALIVALLLPDYFRKGRQTK